jgi:hypothetical protein
MINKKLIIDTYIFLRTNNMSIPDEVLDFIKDASLKELERINMNFTKYKHHGDQEVWVNTGLKGNHKQYCLCYSCKKFIPGTIENNCKIANMVFGICLVNDLVLPVWECPIFEENKNDLGMPK